MDYLPWLWYRQLADTPASAERPQHAPDPGLPPDGRSLSAALGALCPPPLLPLRGSAAWGPDSPAPRRQARSKAGVRAQGARLPGLLWGWQLAAQPRPQGLPGEAGRGVGVGGWLATRQPLQQLSGKGSPSKGHLGHPWLRAPERKSRQRFQAMIKHQGRRVPGSPPTYRPQAPGGRVLPPSWPASRVSTSPHHQPSLPSVPTHLPALPVLQLQEPGQPRAAQLHGQPPRPPPTSRLLRTQHAPFPPPRPGAPPPPAWRLPPAKNPPWGPRCGGGTQGSHDPARICHGTR